MRAACLKGIEFADSITFDPHKTLVPIGSGSCGIFLTPHRSAVEKAFNIRGQPVRTHDDEYMSLQGSRTTSGLHVLVIFLQPERLRRQVETAAHLGDFLREQLKQAGWEIANDTPLPVVCTLHPKIRQGKMTAAEAGCYLAKKGVLAKAEALRPDEPASIRPGVISRRTNEATIRQVVDHLREFVTTK